MEQFNATEYKIQSLGNGKIFEDANWVLKCEEDVEPALIRAVYSQKRLEIRDLPGLYKFSDWLPVEKMLEGSGAPITYKSENLAKYLGLSNLYVTFNGYWPEKGALMKTGTFKECEAYAVCARKNDNKDKVMVVASAGNTARAFAQVCSANKIPVLITIPVDNISAMWFEKPLDPCVKIVASEKGADYFDAIHLSNIAAEMEMFYPEGGAKNIARRDGMGTTVLSAVTTIGRIPDYYFQAIGSATGAIAAWEANMRFIEDGRFGDNKMKLMVSQNIPFTPIKDAWDKKSPEMLPLNDSEARKQVEEIDAKVLSNRKPNYSIKGGLFDAMMDAGGDVLIADNRDAKKANELFYKLEGNDLSPAAAVALATLIEAVEQRRVEKDATIMLNITGGGAEKFKNEHNYVQAEPQMIFPIDPDPAKVKEELRKLFL